MAQLQASAERTGSSFELVEADLENRAAVEATFASQAFEGRGVDAVLLRANYQPSTQRFQ